MKLSEYIAQVGDQKAAKLFSVKERTCQSWRLGTRVPLPEQARVIVKKTGGAVSFEDIYS